MTGRQRALLLTTTIATLGGAGCTWDWDQFAQLRDDLVPAGAPGAWELTFQEECDQPTVNTFKWNTRYTGSGTRFDHYSWSGSYASAQNVSLAAGLCRLTVERRPSGARQYATGVLDSGGKFEQLGGFFEVRMRAPRGVGLRGVAQLASAQRWPPLVDVARINGSDPTRLSQQLTYKNAEGKTDTFSLPVARGPDRSADLHTYGLDWDHTRGVLSFYVDGVKTGESPAEVGRQLTTALKFELTVHAAIEGGETPDATTALPATMEVDWIRAWRRR
jgi:beta-glucanase (GH16 family)